MSLGILILIFFAASVAQSSLINAFAVFGVTPDLVLCLTLVIVFLYEGGYRCIPFGICAALLTACVTEEIAGVGALLVFVSGIGMYFYRKHMRVDSIKPLLAYCAGATLVFQLLYWIIYRMLGNDTSILVMLKSLPMFIIYNTVFAALLFFVMHRGAEEHSNDRYYI